MSPVAMGAVKSSQAHPLSPEATMAEIP
jgi:hypothetical protein